MFSREFDMQSETERLRVTIDLPSEYAEPRVLSLHGAGPSNRARISYLVEHLAQAGWGIVRFDFSGHGDSSGAMNESSLAKRAYEASLVAGCLDHAKAPVLIGSSMGGHVAARLSQSLRPSHLILFCPAAYNSEAENVTFGPNFARIIRQPDSYTKSLAYESISHYTGRLTIIIGARDEIIPNEVIDGYLASARQARSIRLERIVDGPHQLHGWASSNPEAKRSIISVLDEELAR